MNERVKTIRKSENLNQAEFGARLGVTSTAISRIENGERKLTDQMILAICREFNVNENWLRTGVGGEEVAYDESDDTNIAAVISEYKLDGLSQLILKAYVGMDGAKRASFNVLIREMADAVMAENINAALIGMKSIINESLVPDYVKSDLTDKAALVFNESFPNIGIDIIANADTYDPANDWNNGLTEEEAVALVRQRYADKKKVGGLSSISAKVGNE